MKRVYVNEKWCLGCHLCEYNCAFSKSGENNIVKALMGKTITPGIHIEENDKICFAVSCRHCDEPLCVKSCITGAMQAVDGIITVDKDKCVGCYTCILSCPYGAITFDTEGVLEKCELCTKTQTKSPACVAGCPNGAIVFEERENNK